MPSNIANKYVMKKDNLLHVVEWAAMTCANVNNAMHVTRWKLSFRVHRGKSEPSKCLGIALIRAEQ
jgi:hypothetical protein